VSLCRHMHSSLPDEYLLYLTVVVAAVAPLCRRMNGTVPGEYLLYLTVAPLCRCVAVCIVLYLTNTYFT